MNNPVNYSSPFNYKLNFINIFCEFISYIFQKSLKENQLNL